MTCRTGLTVRSGGPSTARPLTFWGGSMRDPKAFARSFAQRLAAAATEQSLTIEANAVEQSIMPGPVRLQPVFRSLDPLQTFMDRDVPRSLAATPVQEWACRRILLPAVDSAIEASTVL